MDDEKKEYSFIGKVEIGTDEYRDLISTTTRLSAELSKMRSDYWNERSRGDKLEKDLRRAQQEIASLRGFIESNEKLVAQYSLYLFEKKQKEESQKVTEE